MDGLLAPAANMNGDIFVLAAQKYGIGTDIDSLNKIVNLVNQGIDVDTAAKLVAQTGNAGGILSYGARYAESPSDPLEMKGKGYFGLLPTADGQVATEISSTDEQGRNYPLLVPTLTQQEIQYLLQGNQPTNDIYNKAEMWAESRRQMGLSPFAAPNEMRVPMGLLGQ